MSNILASRLRFAPDGWARGEREGYGGPCDVTSLSLSHAAENERNVFITSLGRTTGERKASYKGDKKKHT